MADPAAPILYTAVAGAARSELAGSTEISSFREEGGEGGETERSASGAEKQSGRVPPSPSRGEGEASGERGGKDSGSASTAPERSSKVPGAQATGGEQQKGKEANSDKPSISNPEQSSAARQAAAGGAGGGGQGVPAKEGEGGGEQEGEDTKTDVDEMMEAVSMRAVELGKNVASLASSAGLGSAQDVVSNLSEKVSGFGTGFASLFSVFDADPGPAPTAAAPGVSASPAAAPASFFGAATLGLGTGAPAGNGSAGEVDHARRVASRAIDLQASFGLPPQESLLETFPCKLVQTYTCAHNTFTPDIAKAFNGNLYLTEKNVCFLLDPSERRVPIRVRVEDLSGISREHPRNTKKGDAAAGGSSSSSSSRGTQDQLRLSLKPGATAMTSAAPTTQAASSVGGSFQQSASQWMLLSGFQSVEDLESALALLEHLTGSE